MLSKGFLGTFEVCAGGDDEDPGRVLICGVCRV